MNHFLSKNKIDYVLFHLNMVFEVTEELRSLFSFQESHEIPDESGKIVFWMSNMPLDQEKVISIGDLPVLFPNLKSEDSYHIKDGNLIFNHDFLKSAFYLLSGYQELDPDYLDSMGRFPYSLSIQHKLNFTDKPLVNYYFEIIAQGVEEFCRANKIPYKRRSYFNKFGFFLTHDVDMVDTYTIYEVGYRFKQAFGLSKPFFNTRKSLAIAFNYLFNFLNFIKRKNPVWDFTFLRSIEKRYGFRSAFYFLPKGRLHHDAYYSFKEKRIKSLVNELTSENCEIGLHGTVTSSESLEQMKDIYHYIKQHLSHNVQGIRQHRLLFNIKKSPLIYENVGLLYDTSLGFAEHEGFRNSFCLPFKLFDHENDKMLKIWEIPLIVMDATLFSYRNYNVILARESVEKIIEEVEKFQGIFTLLWHNGHFDELRHPGIKEFYIELLGYINEKGAENMLGNEFIARIDHINRKEK